MGIERESVSVNERDRDQREREERERARDTHLKRALLDPSRDVLALLSRARPLCLGENSYGPYLDQYTSRFSSVYNTGSALTSLSSVSNTYSAVPLLSLFD